ncbi:cadherin-related family member 2 [Megalops cyprinoides]|uniref:cadherin-related family member 2 n=1 Tax=Megalops cyprinoides TaxID=118141 RepID=UPI0018652F3C|nr:cadherin-related family member 2 [Megalops cyprinoides]
MRLVCEKKHVFGYCYEKAVTGDYAFRILATESTGAPIRYRITGENAFYFTVNADTGNVTIRTLLDREIPRNIPVIVSDANDNPPIFIDAPYNVDVKENTSINTVIFQAIATDLDFNLAGIVSYSIVEAVPEEGMNLFSISPADGSVTLMGGLNYTSKSTFYRLRIKASDGGGPLGDKDNYVQVGFAVAFITVSDVPDLDPQFLRLPYLTTVKEHSNLGLSVFEVQAIDPDTGVNDVIRYSIANSNAPGLFAMNENTGVISIRSSIDRENLLESNGEVILQVVATESNLNVNGIHASTSVDVRITIEDINDHKPMFYMCEALPCDFSQEMSSYRASVDEHSSVGTVLDGLNIAVRDMDVGANARIKMHLEGPDKDAFSVSPASFDSTSLVQILISKPNVVDYEEHKIMSVQVVATDTSKPMDCCSTANVTIEIRDINDITPVFEKDSYELTVKEHSSVGTVLGTITATDPDTEDVGNITYRLVPENILRYFTVDPKNGSVMVNNDNLDREIRDSYSATLQAIDSADHIGTTNLDITLLDINDKAPEMARNSYFALLLEGPEGKMEISIQAFDADEENTVNSQIRYGIVNSEFSGNFTIDPITGMLQNNGELDRESIDPSANGVIELNVTASDMGDPSLSSSVMVIVNVEDINDNAPRFRNHDYKFSVKESEKGAFVGSVFAYDADQTVNNNRISFRITDASSRNFFINSIFEGAGEGYMGNISVDLDIELDYEHRSTPYILTVEATDQGQRKDTARVEVTVIDVNDERPIFPTGVSVRVKENSTYSPVEVATIVGTDVDTNHSLIYELLALDCRCNGTVGPCEEDWFELQPTGAVTVNDKFVIDYEKCDQVVLEAQVVDIFTEKGMNNSVPGKLTIHIDDINDNFPEFIVAEALFVVVTESTESGSSVATVTATDRDSGINKEIKFSVLAVDLIDTNNNTVSMGELFTVDTTAEQNKYVGTIRTIGKLDSNLKGKYLLTVQAEDGGQLKTTTKLEIYTIDQSYRVGLRFESPVAEVQKNLNVIRGALTSATKATVHILEVVAESGEERAKEYTLLEAYFVYPNGSAINSATVEKILQEDLYHASILRQYGLTVISGLPTVTKTDPVRFILLGLVAGLLIVLVVMITSLVCTQRNYKRKLKAAKAMNSAAMVATENSKTGPVVPGTNKYTMQANPVLNLNIDTTDLGFDEEDSSTDRVSLNSLDYNIDMNETEKDTMPMMVIQEEDEDANENFYIEPLHAALAERVDDTPHSFDNPTLDTTDL